MEERASNWHKNWGECLERNGIIECLHVCLLRLRSVTFSFVPGGGSAVAAGRGGERVRQASMDVRAIRAAIAQAKSLDEVRRLEMMLQSGQVPGRERGGVEMEDMDMHFNGPT